LTLILNQPSSTENWTLCCWFPSLKLILLPYSWPAPLWKWDWGC